jgi:hypothetical protein
VPRGPLPRPLTIPDVLTLQTLADVRVLVEKHLPAEYRSKWPARRCRSLDRAADRAPARGRHVPVEQRRFPPPWDIEEHNRSCFIVRDNNGQALSYVYYETEPGRRTAANLLTRDEARRIAANIAKLPERLNAEPKPDANPLIHRRPT